MNTAPSIYEYQSTAEWEQAMKEWCEENEPQFVAVYDDGQRDVFQPCTSEQEAREVCAKHNNLDDPFFKPYVRKVTGDDVEIIRPFGQGGEGKTARSIDHLDGGSRADYRMAGITRY